MTLNKMRRDEAALLSSNSDDDEGFTSFYLKHLKEQSLGLQEDGQLYVTIVL